MRLTIRRRIGDIRNTQVAQPAGVYSNSISNGMGPTGACPSDLGTSFMLVSCGMLGMEEGGPRWADSGGWDAGTAGQSREQIQSDHTAEVRTSSW